MCACVYVYMCVRVCECVCVSMAWPTKGQSSLEIKWLLLCIQNVLYVQTQWVDQGMSSGRNITPHICNWAPGPVSCEPLTLLRLPNVSRLCEYMLHFAGFEYSQKVAALCKYFV
jgi:hypothetical protein